MFRRSCYNKVVPSTEVNLRRFEIVVNYSAAFLFWNLRGILAEKWAHGPHFGAFSDQGPSQFTLTADAGPMDQPIGANESKVRTAGMAGLRQSSFVWEDPIRQKAAEEIGLQWLTDVIDVAKPKVVQRIHIRRYHSKSIRRPDAVQKKIDDEFLSGNSVGPPNYHHKFNGVAFQYREHDLTTTGQFGIWGNNQTSQWFMGPSPNDKEWNLGLFMDFMLDSKAGFDDPLSELNNLITQSRTESAEVQGRTIRRIGDG
jgi:hypothetical protein